MALSIVDRQPCLEPNETDDLLALDFYDDDGNRGNGFRPLLAKKLQGGYLACDQITQTRSTEIIDIKQLFGTVGSLVKEMTGVKRDFDFTKQFLEAAFEKKLQDKSYELSSKLNDRLRDLQNVHEDRVAIVRRSFKQQLQDALVKMKAHYKSYYEAKLAGKLQHGHGLNVLTKVKSLETELAMSQEQVQLLQSEVHDLQEEIAKKDATLEELKDNSTLEKLQDQNRDLQVEIMHLSDKIDELTQTVRFREERIASLDLELSDSKTEMDKQKETTKQLALQLDKTNKKVMYEKMEAEKQLSDQRSAFERELEDRIAVVEVHFSNSQLEKQKQLAAMEAMMEEKLQEEKKNYEVHLALINEEAQLRASQMQGSINMQQIFEQQNQEILLLRQKLLKLDKQWEKKFSILRASLHALKDEAYIRLQLQKRSFSLRYASVNYGADVASTQHPAIEPGPTLVKPLLPAIKPLPSITRGGRLIPGKRETAVSNTPMTVPFSDDDEEDDDEPDPDGFIPLPPKPHTLRDYLPVTSHGL